MSLFLIHIIFPVVIYELTRFKLFLLFLIKFLFYQLKRIYLTDKKSLAYFHEKATPKFWDKHWEIDDLRKYILSNTSEANFLPLVKKYLPPGSKILEGGCGRGQIVNALKHQGFNPTGVDFTENNVKNVNKGVPGLDVRLADVRNLAF